MQHILIADAGSTKTDWALADDTGKVVFQLSSQGINAAVCTDAQIDEIFNEVSRQIPSGVSITRISFYGAGCATETICRKISTKLKSTFNANEVEVASDLLGACRCVAGKRPGIVCILGTGSNACLYDGHNIADSVPSLGFILGDEGSGSALGKRLLSDAFKRILPEEIRNQLFYEYQLDYGKVIEKVYRGDTPNAYLASFVPFIHSRLDNVDIRKLVYDEFDRFLKRNVLAFKDAYLYEVNFVGGIAIHFEDILREALSANNLKCGNIIERPLESLVKYHSV